MQFDLVGGSYANRYAAVSTERTVNYYIHKVLLEDEKDKFQHSLQSTPGLTQILDTSAANVRGLFVARTSTYNRCFVICDTHIKELVYTSGSWSLVDKGTLTGIDNDVTTVYMEVNFNHQVMIAHPSVSYILDMTTDTLTKITDSSFPGSAQSLSYSAGYFLITTSDPATGLGGVWYSNLGNGFLWATGGNANYFVPSGRAAITTNCQVFRDYLICFTSETIEVYTNDGTTPFTKQLNSTIQLGLDALSIESVCVTDQGLFFVGISRVGSRKVYFHNGWQCQPISIPAIDWQLNNPSVTGQLQSLTTIDMLNTITIDKMTDVIGYTISNIYAQVQYSKSGHLLYLLTIPALHTTFVYDMTSQEWTERQSLYTDNTTQFEFRGRHFQTFHDVNVYTDAFSGKIFYEDYTNLTEDGQPITRTRITNILFKEKYNLSIYNIELDSTVGVGLASTPTTNANIDFYFSKDGGNTYSAKTSLKTGASTSYLTRPRVFKLGTARNWTFKIQQTDSADICLNSCNIHGILGSW